MRYEEDCVLHTNLEDPGLGSKELVREMAKQDKEEQWHVHTSPYGGDRTSKRRGVVKEGNAQRYNDIL